MRNEQALYLSVDHYHVYMEFGQVAFTRILLLWSILVPYCRCNITMVENVVATSLITYTRTLQYQRDGVIFLAQLSNWFTGWGGGQTCFINFHSVLSCSLHTTCATLALLINLCFLFFRELGTWNKALFVSVPCFFFRPRKGNIFDRGLSSHHAPCMCESKKFCATEIFVFVFCSGKWALGQYDLYHGRRAPVSILLRLPS